MLVILSVSDPCACFSLLDVGGPADPIAPTIIIPPRNTSVALGTSEVTMECVANARSGIPPLLHSDWTETAGESSVEIAAEALGGRQWLRDYS